MKSPRLGISILIITSLLLAIGIAELGFRSLLPATYLLDWHSKEYWNAKFVSQIKQDKYANLSNEAGKNIIYDSSLGWRMKPLYNRNGVQHNSKGFRGKKEYDSQPNENRIFALGDSYTYGLGVSDVYTFSSLLNDEPDVEVINAGVNGYGIDQAYLMWEKEGKKLNPKIVVLGYFIDDFYRNAYLVRGKPKPHFVYDKVSKDFVLKGVPVPDSQVLYDEGELEVDSWLRVFRVFPWVKRGLHRMLGPSKELDSYSYELLLQKAKLNEYILKKFNDSVTKSGARLLVVFIGTHKKCYKPSLEAQWVENSVIETCQENNIEYINLAEIMRQDGYYFSFYAQHCHFTESGHRFTAKKIAEKLGLSN